MSDASDNESQVYPSASIVVGVGRVGLAVLEQLGERWGELRAASGDPTLKNLRLLHVRPDDDGRGGQWRRQERQYIRIAKYSGDDDLPSRALDFVILRSLGIIRFRDGAYQVAIPRDRGVVEESSRGTSARRRYFEWTHLSPDPIGAAERLSQADQEIADLKRFADPLFNRVKLGHSPQALLAAISRCRALAEGRDPSPWPWIVDEMAAGGERPDIDEGYCRIPFDSEWLGPADRRGILENFADEPLAGWAEWFRAHHSGVSSGSAEGPGPLEVTIPEPFVPHPEDLEAPLRPTELLKGDWEKTGWATERSADNRHAPFRPAEVGEFRLGLFDHDDSSEVQRSRQDQFAERLTELGVHAHRGLVRLWVDLQRDRVDTEDHHGTCDRHRGDSSESLRQSLELLGELVVRPVAADGADEEQLEQDLDELEFAAGDDEWWEEEGFALEPSERLLDLTIGGAEADNEAARALRDRLEDLGFSSESDPLPDRRLFRQVTWTPEDASPAEANDTTLSDPDAEKRRRPGALEFRSVLNDEVRHLFHFDRLREVRQGTTKRPPRLNIYVVGDMGEPFCRSSTRPVLRAIHAELSKAFGPLFESYREGFNRTLAIHPILWTPHPADAFGGRYPVENRCEEAAIIESVQGIRRWVESVPDETQCIPQIFVNGRVTDSAVLGRQEAVDETYDFLSLEIRNRLGEDPWLRKVATGAAGSDLFATFSSHQIEFPAHTAREYLANRLARDSLRELEQGGENNQAPSFAREALDPPAPDEIEQDGRERLRDHTRREAESCATSVEGRLAPDFWTTTERLRETFDSAYGEQLVERIHDRWRALTREKGEMDEVVDDLRRRSANRLGQLLANVGRVGDELIEEYASRGDLGAAKAGFNDLDRVARDWLRETEKERRGSEQDCLDNAEPSMSPVEQARQAINDVAPEKPRGDAMAVGITAWALLAPALGAPMAWALAMYLELAASPGLFEVILGPLGYLTGGLVVFLLGGYLMYRHMRQITQRLQEAIDDLGGAVRRVVHGSGEGLDPETSIRSFVEARFGHAVQSTLRNYAHRTYESIVRDDALARRIYKSIDIQRRQLMRRAEQLGVHADTDRDSEDLTELFSGGVTRDRRSLLEPEQLEEYYRSRIGTRLQIRRALPDFIDQTGGFADWRRTAVMADERRLLDYGRGLFGELVDRPVAEQMAFGQQAGDRIVDFVGDVYPNMGFGAKFTGFEGMDPDGIDVVADTALVLNPQLRGVFERARERNGVEAETETLDVIEADIDPNSAFMLSLASGIRPHSIQNLSRHESYTDRSEMPDDRTFPLSGEPSSAGSSAPINHLTGHDELRASLNDTLLRHAGEHSEEATGVPTASEAARAAAARSTDSEDSDEGDEQRASAADGGSESLEEGGTDAG